MEWILASFTNLSLNVFLPSFLSGVDFFFNLDLYLFLSLLYGTQVHSFAAIPAICRLCFLIVVSAIPGGYCCAPNFFLQFKEFELYWGAVFSLRCVHTFSWFLSQIGVVIFFGHAETGSGAPKASGFPVWIFPFNFKVEWEKGVWTKIRLLDSGFLLTCGNFTLIFNCFFFIFLNCIFFKWFSQSIHSF